MAQDEESPQDMKQYYLLGLLVLIAVVVAGYMLRPKTASMTSPTSEQAAAPVLGPITGLACDDQYYNPVIGFPRYYFSVEGGDVSSAKKVDCTMTVVVNDKEVASEKMSSPLTEKPQRGGSTFRCTTSAIDLEPGVAARVDVVLKDDLKGTATCSATFIPPAP